jgi:cytidine deaminase
VVATDGNVYVGCNVEHRFRSHDIHAETNALASMIAANGSNRAEIVFIAAERELFTPCGACLDWIFELGGPNCSILVQSDPSMTPLEYRAIDLMPHYPR